MDDAAPPDLLADLLARLRAAREAAAADPFGDPVLLVALDISRALDEGRLSAEALTALIARMAREAASERAARIAAYTGMGEDRAVLARLAARLVRPDPEDSPVPFAAYRDAVERIRFAAVFTAHPTFSLPLPTEMALAEAACGAILPDGLAHRPAPVTLEDEFAQAAAAIARGRDALDVLSDSLFEAGRAVWGDRALALLPRPVILSSWVGYDTDGRTDIGWQDTLRLRLRMKRLQLARLADRLEPLGDCAAPIVARARAAEAAVAAQEAAAPAKPDAQSTRAFALAMVEGHDTALTTPGPLLALFATAMEAAPDAATRQALAVQRAGLVAHGLALAHTHVRLNSTQVHNALRQRLGIAASPEDRAARRGLLAQINAALAEVVPLPLDFGALLAEQASAVKLVMTVAQMVKHIDGSHPVRFLIAETETGYTLLSALWLARRFGIADKVEISPLFETADALERGERVLEEALRSPHFRDYLRMHGRLCLQFGYSDSGRYVGQLAASYLAERLKIRLAEQLRRHGLEGVELVLFDTHGESIGRGGHPSSLADRFAYLSPPAARAALAAAGLPLREEAAFQGGDGYLLFGTERLALATVARIAEHAFAPPAEAEDPIYTEADWGADFFATIRREMATLVEDPGYAALLGAFGPGLLDKTGSRPAARQADGGGGPVRITHPSQLRAIPNNAILHQMGFLANTLHGIGTAAAANPEVFADLAARSPRFARALAMARRAAACSDIGVLRAAVDMLDPSPWLDRAGFTKRPGRRETLTSVAMALERLDLSPATRRMFRRLQADHQALRAAWPDLPVMPDRLVLAHALRLCLVQRLWLLAAALPEFSPRHGQTRETLIARLLQLDVPPVLDLLGQIFPAAPDPSSGLDFGEPTAPREGASYAAEHAAIFGPMAAYFALVRECSAVISHEVGAFG
ncbi:phosphoenolpyruvate carboxylase [Neoroseomonas oryzicola]|uniref:Phosphoenolpyruvate carboxylase n=1 Tax=Neoroseomonas oryzicola TaxID=535904 RepID=A0A9X9WD04_9PROT|nr:phosphoenolpyruvate carboxylase [Neoroseomonas oryzicola]MBR0658214.1 phosphoenolpyruvate carboxylase [Neoroseomonas oryzicola]NKE15969.1 phosphoenolpyruvate carboxylase [Neoroseomonas oryzicola]